MVVSNFMQIRSQNLIAEVRHFLSRRLIQRVAGGLGIKEIFFLSQSWEGYENACDRWNDAYWKWIDDEADNEIVERLKGLQIDYAKVCSTIWLELPCAENEKSAWLLELTRQEILQENAVFRLAMRGPEAEDPETLELFLDDINVAARIGINTHFVEFAKQKQRKPTKDKGDRRLKAQLLILWIPGCLWAFTTDGIAQFLNVHFPRTGNKLYNSKTIADVWRDLGLYHLQKPLWWGIAGKPPKLMPMS
jgi:hypothetical protein